MKEFLCTAARLVENGTRAVSPSMRLETVQSHAPTEIRDLETFKRLHERHVGVFIVTDLPTRRVVVHSPGCPFLTERSFETKVVEGRSRNGRYLWAPDVGTALKLAGAVRCRHPGDVI